ncbi:glycoside hydrolase family 6 protein [Nonomuraea polychroma]|uniref:glycoside hydrolase family 6 protein n=1 Tax=Nonomuraea polychroma TaxID=46176 RepID=UPI003D8A0A3E
MGVVYLGQGPDGTRMAVKLIHARMDADAGFRQRFAREVLMRKLAAVPHAVRLNEPEVRAKVEETITGAEQSGGDGVPVFLIDYMRGSDCHSIGASDMAAYQDWIKGIAGQINDAKAVIILEPGSLVKMDRAFEVSGLVAVDLLGTGRRSRGKPKASVRVRQYEPRRVTVTTSRPVAANAPCSAQRVPFTAAASRSGTFPR